MHWSSRWCESKQQQTKTNYNQEERGDGDVGETEQPNNRQKQTKNMKNITQKFRFRLTFSLGLDSGVGVPYMQFQAWNCWGFFILRARSVRRNPVDFYNFRWIFRIQWISIFLLNATTLNPGKNPAKRVLPLEVNHFSLDTGFWFFFIASAVVHQYSRTLQHSSSTLVFLCYTHHFYSSSLTLEWNKASGWISWNSCYSCCNDEDKGEVEESESTFKEVMPLDIRE